MLIIIAQLSLVVVLTRESGWIIRNFHGRKTMKRGRERQRRRIKATGQTGTGVVEEEQKGKKLGILSEMKEDEVGQRESCTQE